MFSRTISSSRNGFRYDYFFALVRYGLSYHKSTGFRKKSGAFLTSWANLRDEKHLWC